MDLYLPLPPQPKLVLIYPPRRDGRLSWPDLRHVVTSCTTTVLTWVDLSRVSTIGRLMRLAMIVAGSRHGQRPAR